MFEINKKFKEAVALVIMILVLILVGGCSKQKQTINNDSNKQKEQEHDDRQKIMEQEKQNEEDVIPPKDKQSTYIETSSQTQTEVENQKEVEVLQGQHNHNWLPQTQTTTYEEVGHFETRVVETVYAWRTFCNKCGKDISDLKVEEITFHSAVLCESGYHADYVVMETKTEQVWVVDTPAHTETIITGYSCDCGATRK